MGPELAVIAPAFQPIAPWSRSEESDHPIPLAIAAQETGERIEALDPRTPCFTERVHHGPDHQHESGIADRTDQSVDHAARPADGDHAVVFRPAHQQRQGRCGGPGDQRALHLADQWPEPGGAQCQRRHLAGANGRRRVGLHRQQPAAHPPTGGAVGQRDQQRQRPRGPAAGSDPVAAGNRPRRNTDQLQRPEPARRHLHRPAIPGRRQCGPDHHRGRCAQRPCQCAGCLPGFRADEPGHRHREQHGRRLQRHGGQHHLFPRQCGGRCQGTGQCDPERQRPRSDGHRQRDGGCRWRLGRIGDRSGNGKPDDQWRAHPGRRGERRRGAGIEPGQFGLGGQRQLGCDRRDGTGHRWWRAVHCR
mmetsp:Transcript_10698/g.43853  ORF Transcript_10698/g.43853 Transcript_10698/m.43853 type:complete len:361 (+) Transcript_10698:1622-2704(+)